MPGNVFISYRREDTAGYAGRLYDRLKAAFPGRVFIDVGEILPGADFVQTIEQHIAGCAALIALIGANGTAHDRLQDPSDFVRLEIASALKRRTTAIPVLVGGGKLPPAATLPEDIQPLLRHQTISITDEDWDHGCERLIHALQAAIGPARKQSKPALRWGAAVAAAVVLVLTLVLALFLKGRIPGPAANTSQGPPTTMPETMRGARDYDKSVAKGYDNAAQKMDEIANKIGGAGNAPAPNAQATPANRQSSTVQSPQFTYGTWTLNDAVDKDGHHWDNSTLKITSQSPAPDGLLLEGFFEWIDNGVPVGIEYVSGHYVAAHRQVILEGHSVKNMPGQAITEGSYSAVLSEDERSLSGGTWGSVAGRQAGVPGQWRATR